MKTKIFCCITGTWSNGDVHVSSMYEKDGKLEGIAGHLSSSIGFAQHDIGFTSKWKHEIYENLFPEGYELEWVDNPKTHSVLSKYCEDEHQDDASK